MASAAEAEKVAGNAAFREGRFKEAVDHFNRAITLDCSNAVLFSNRSGAYASISKFTEALSDADSAIALRPDWAKGYSRRAAALYGLRRYADAISTYKQGLGFDPGNAQMLQAVADVTTKLQEAKALFDAAVEGSLARVRELLRLGSGPDDYVSEDGTTALMMAARLGSVEVVSELMGGGAAAARRNKAGETAASLARRNGHEAVIKVLPVEERPSFGGGFFAAAKGLATSAATSAREIAELAKMKTAAAGVKELHAKEAGGTATMGEEYAAVIKNREERRRREEAEKVAEVLATKRRAIEARLAQQAEEDDLQLLRQLALNRQKEEREKQVEAARHQEEQRAQQEAQAVAAAAEAEAARAAAELKAAEARVEQLREDGNQAFKSAQYVEAVHLYTQALQLTSEGDATSASSVLFSNRSGALTALQKYPQALADAERCVAARPMWAKGHTRRASALHGLKRFMDAIQSFDEALTLEPGSDVAIKGRRVSSFALAQE
mmetsp:Transcript_43792/g.72772  ORF Transcript_43792/g.72772 Transcript_43792/m.72772 type:complete len:496 (-) Transcript_43792:344-1831(-)